MPSHEIHLFVDEIFLGKTYPNIHRALDWPALFYGKGHRRFFHSPREAIEIAMFLFPGDFDAVLAALLHLIVDDICSSDPSFEMWLDIQVNKAKEDKKSNTRFRKMLADFFFQLNRNNQLLCEWLVKDAGQQMEANAKLIGQLLGTSKKTKKKRKRKKKDPLLEALKKIWNLK